MKRFQPPLKFCAGLALLAAMMVSTGCAGMGQPLLGRSMFQKQSTASNAYASPEMYETSYIEDDTPNRPSYSSTVSQRPARTASTGSC